MDEQSKKQDDLVAPQTSPIGETFTPTPEVSDEPSDNTPAPTPPLEATSPTPALTQASPAPAVSEPTPSAAPTPPVLAGMGTSQPTGSRSKLPLMIAVVVIGLAVLIGAILGAYRVGNNQGYTSGKKAEAATVAATQIKVPTDATMTAQCAEGEGTQYVKPSDIPMGPIYNVWKGKVTGIEYMLGQSEIANSKTLDLALQNQKYDHVDVMYEPSGHAGFTEPHYHVVLSMISYSEEQMITCGSSSSSKSMM